MENSMNWERARTDLRTDGVTLIREAVKPDFVESLLSSFAQASASDRPRSKQVLYTHGPAPSGRPPLSALMDQWLSPHRYQGTASTLPCADRIRPLANALLEAETVLFQDLILSKRPEQARFPWHQDFGFWPLDRPTGVVLWVPLQDSGPKNGGLRFAVGSQKLGKRPVVDLHTGKPQDGQARLGFDPGQWPIFAPTYRKGDVVAFTPLTFHASPEMRSAGRRVAWSCVFLSPDVRWKHSNAPNHPLCSHVTDGEPVQEVLSA
jgi:ectoine hydroxylase-related dioxygenase (phytanoyl-CoA dioxygenase family)